MAIDRQIDVVDYSSGTVFGTDVSQTLNYFAQRDLKQLTNVVGTNAIVATFPNVLGFSSISGDTTCILRVVSNNTGAVTLKLQNQTGAPVDLTTAIPIVRRNGSALAANDFIANSFYPLVYNSTITSWVVLCPVPSDIPGIAVADKYFRKTYKRILFPGFPTLPSLSTAYSAVITTTVQNVISASSLILVEFSYWPNTSVIDSVRVKIDGVVVVTDAILYQASGITFLKDFTFSLGDTSAHTMVIEMKTSSGACNLFALSMKYSELES